MDKHKPSDEMIKDLDNLLSKLNAMEILASNEFEISRSTASGIITIKTVVIMDSNSDGVPDYLDKDTVINHSSS